MQEVLQEAQLPQRDSARSLIAHITEHRISCTTIVVSKLSANKPSPYTWPLKLSNLIYFQGHLSL